VTLLILLALSPVSICGVADMTLEYPVIDTGLAIEFTVFHFENEGSRVRVGPYLCADLRSDLGRPDWYSTGVYIGREIQRNVSIGVLFGYRSVSGHTPGVPGEIQAGFYIGVDVVPWIQSK